MYAIVDGLVNQEKGHGGSDLLINVSTFGFELVHEANHPCSVRGIRRGPHGVKNWSEEQNEGRH